MTTIDQILKDIIELDFKFHFVTNSIRFCFTSKIAKQEMYGLWIEPFWRFTKNEQLIMSSMTCPWHESFKEDEEYSNAFHSWCDTVTHLKSIPLKCVKRGTELNDLVVEWTDGTKLHVYQDSNENEGWYIKNEGNRIYYEAFPNEIKERKEEQ
jgi:hypothetical protein